MPSIDLSIIVRGASKSYALSRAQSLGADRSHMVHALHVDHRQNVKGMYMRVASAVLLPRLAQIGSTEASSCPNVPIGQTAGHPHHPCDPLPEFPADDSCSHALKAPSGRDPIFDETGPDV